MRLSVSRGDAVVNSASLLNEYLRDSNVGERRHGHDEDTLDPELLWRRNVDSKLHAALSSVDDLKLVVEELRLAAGRHPPLLASMSSSASLRVEAEELHKKARGHHPQYPKRVHVADDDVPWEKPFPQYEPTPFTHLNVLKDSNGKRPEWADPPDFKEGVPRDCSFIQVRNMSAIFLTSCPRAQ